MKNKLGNKVTNGDCSTKTDGSYALTVTLGEAIINTGIDKNSPEWKSCEENYPNGAWDGITMEETCSCIVTYGLPLCDCSLGNDNSLSYCQCIQDKESEEECAGL